MAEFLVKYWYVILGVGLGGGVLWVTLSSRRPNEHEGHSKLGYFVWGPLWPAIDNYLSRRRGFTRREILGWAIVLALILIFIALNPHRAS